jgi:hypothetical protein
MRKVLWERGHSVATIELKAGVLCEPRNTHSEFEAYTAEECERVRLKRVRIERLAGRTRDKSRDVVRQSNGYVMSGWSKLTKAGVSHASRRLSNQQLKKLVIG